MAESLRTIYIEDVDGIYFAYKSKSDKYAGPKLVDANIDRDVADALCEATTIYNSTQALLCDIYNA